MTGSTGTTLQLSAIAAVATAAVLGYLLYRARQGHKDFTLIDAMILALLSTILFGAARPLFDVFDQEAKRSALQRNLHTLRTQIELYRIEHGGRSPLVHHGTFPQLIRATNAQGVPGEPGARFPFGPYLRSGVPVNPLSGRSIVATTEEFPPKAPTGGGGWVYHEPTGRIAADLEGFRDE